MRWEGYGATLGFQTKSLCRHENQGPKRPGIKPADEGTADRA
jgi:hypothetical protein